MREVITMRQKSDMGTGFGYVEDAFYANNSNEWGTVCIINRNSDIIRKFDYDTYNNNIFYHHLCGWEYQLTVREAKFTYCFMNKDITIYLN